MLSDEDRAVLAVELRRWNYQGAKATAIRDELGMSLTAYYQRLRTIIEQPSALEEQPQLVNRLRRLQDVRRVRRGARV